MYYSGGFIEFSMILWGRVYVHRTVMKPLVEGWKHRADILWKSDIFGMVNIFDGSEKKCSRCRDETNVSSDLALFRNSVESIGHSGRNLQSNVQLSQQNILMPEKYQEIQVYEKIVKSPLKGWGIFQEFVFFNTLLNGHGFGSYCPDSKLTFDIYKKKLDEQTGVSSKMNGKNT